MMIFMDIKGSLAFCWRFLGSPRPALSSGKVSRLEDFILGVLIVIFPYASMTCMHAYHKTPRVPSATLRGSCLCVPTVVEHVNLLEKEGRVVR